MGWDIDEAEIWLGFRGWSRWQGKVAHNELTSILVVKMLVKDDLVHALSEVKVDLGEKSRCVGGGFSSESLCVLGEAEYSVHLLIVNLWDLVSRHVLDIVAIADDGVCIDSALVGFLESLGKESGILFIK